MNNYKYVLAIFYLSDTCGLKVKSVVNIGTVVAHLIGGINHPEQACIFWALTRLPGAVPQPLFLSLMFQVALF